MELIIAQNCMCNFLFQSWIDSKTISKHTKDDPRPPNQARETVLVPPPFSFFAKTYVFLAFVVTYLAPIFHLRICNIFLFCFPTCRSFLEYIIIPNMYSSVPIPNKSRLSNKRSFAKISSKSINVTRKISLKRQLSGEIHWTFELHKVYGWVVSQKYPWDN